MSEHIVAANYVTQKAMVFKAKISALVRGRAYALRKSTEMSFGDIAKVCKISKSSARRCNCSLQKVIETPSKKAKLKRGRPKRLTERDIRHLIRSIERLRKVDVNFTIKTLVEFSGLSLDRASYRTYARALNTMGYKYLEMRKKGLLSEQDKRHRLRFAKQ